MFDERVVSFVGKIDHIYLVLHSSIRSSGQIDRRKFIRQLNTCCLCATVAADTAAAVKNERSIRNVNKKKKKQKQMRSQKKEKKECEMCERLNDFVTHIDSNG